MPCFIMHCRNVSQPPIAEPQLLAPKRQPSGNPQRPHAEGKPLHLGVIRGGPELDPLVLGTLAPVATPSISLSIDCLIETGCLFANF